MHVQDRHGLPLRAEREGNCSASGKRGNLSVDSTGFSKHRFDRWLDIKERRERARGYLKVHIACYDDGFVPSIRATGSYVSDGTKLIPLLKRVRGVSSVRADGAYAWRTNAQFIEDIGSVPYLKPRKDAIGGSRGYPAWRNLMLRYNSGREIWLEEYRKRWIVESVFSSVKRRLGPFLFSRRAYTQRRELIMKFIVHNLILCARGR